MGLWTAVAAALLAIAMGQGAPPAVFQAAAGGIVPPIVVSEAPLEIPADPLRLLAQGEVVLEATVTAGGEVAGVRVSVSYEPDIDRLAAAALARWTFRPAEDRGTAVPVRVRFTYPVAPNGATSWATSPGVAFVPGPAVTAPRVIREVVPTYPGPARDAGISGTVRLSCIVLPDGTPMAVTVRAGVEATLDRAAVDAVRRWRFEPGRRNGVAVPVLIEVETAFRGGSPRL
jgi:protein TonB